MKITNLLNVEQFSKSAQKEQFAMDVLTGLCSRPKSIASKYFYDDQGSQYFQQITQQPEYYLTSTEFQILTESKHLLSQLITGNEIDIIELGVGDGHKTKIILDGFLENGFRVNFFPIDISKEAMELLSENLGEGENLSIHGVVSEYIEGLRYIHEHSNNQILVLFLGSNIGNFDRASSQKFLRMLWKNLEKDDYVFIGFYLKKDIKKLTKAYNDSAGVTEAFNLNLLKRINHELGGNFDVTQFQHFGSYHPILGAMESYLVSKIEQEVYIAELERSFTFDAFEPIHLEYSFKYLKKDIENLAKETGYEIVHHFSDQDENFIDSLWKAKKEVNENIL